MYGVCNNSQPCSASKTFTVSAYPAAVGQRNGTSDATINAITNPSRPSNQSTLGMFEDRQYIIYSQCTDLHYTFFTNLSRISLILYVRGSCSSLDGSIDRLSIPVELFRCPPAFNLSQSTHGCVCEERLQKYTNSCDINIQKILLDGDFWFLDLGIETCFYDGMDAYVKTWLQFVCPIYIWGGNWTHHVHHTRVPP